MILFCLKLFNHNLIRRKFFLGITLLLIALLSWPFCASATTQVALIDTDGRFIIPFNHEGISYVGSGLYLDGNQNLPKFVDISGNEVSFKLPHDCKVEFVNAPGRARWDGAARECLIFISRGDKLGVVGLDRHIIVEPRYLDVRLLQPGVIRADDAKRDGTQYLFDTRKNVFARLKGLNIPMNGEIYLGEERLLLPGNSIGLSALVDLSGKTVCPAKFFVCGAFKAGTAPADYKIADHLVWALINRKGQTVKMFPSDVSLDIFSDKKSIIATRQIEPGKFLYGLVDRHGNFILPCKFRELDRNGDYLFAKDTDGRARIFTEDGKILVECPKDTQDISIGDMSLIAVGICPEVEYQQKQKEHLKYGYIDLSGRIVIAPRFFKACGFYGDWAAAAEMEDGQILERYGIIDKNGKWKVQPQFDFMQEGAPGQFIATYLCRNFNSEMWRRENSLAEIDRIDLFDFLLREYSLIGMSNEKVLQLLGPPKSMGPGTSKWSYVLHSLPNGQNQPSLELEFDQNRNVSRYRCPYLDTFDEGPWFEHNMIFVSAKPGHQWRGKLQAK